MLKLTHLLAVISIIAASYSSFIDVDQVIKLDFWLSPCQQSDAPEVVQESLVLVKIKDEVQS